jgi:MFS family permease
MNQRGRRIAFVYLFSVFLLTAVGETLISTLFPLIREDLDLSVADQAIVTASLTLMIGIGNLVGGWIGLRHSDRLAVRSAALLLAFGAFGSAASNGLLQLCIAQVVMGAGVGLFFGPGLASIGRMYAEMRGRAIASYGLAYSLGLATAAFAANVGVELWRVVFLTVGVLALGLTLVTPDVADGPREPVGPLFGSALTYSRLPLYRLALVTGAVAGTVHYVIVGLTPEYFVTDRAVALGVVTAFIGVGRIVSMVGKYLAGWAFDRFGGPRSAQLIMSAVLVFGAAELLLPGRWGLLPILPFAAFTSMLFPVSNAMVVTSLPPRASWGVGVYRSTLMLASAVCAGLMSLALLRFETRTVMIAGLAIPAAGIAVIMRHIRRTPSDPSPGVAVAPA